MFCCKFSYEIFSIITTRYFRIKNNKKKSNNPPIKKITRRNKKSKKSYINNIETNGGDKSGNFDSNLEINNINNLKDKNINLMIKNSLSNNKQNLNNINNIPYNDYELNSLDYKEALLKDKRSYIQYYFSLLRRKQILISNN